MYLRPAGDHRVTAPIGVTRTPALIVDGRIARRDRNRIAVLDAVIALFAEGVLDPVPEEVATHSGLSVRSVYRYFDDRDALLRAAIDRNLERVRPLFLMHGIGEGAFDVRVEQFVTSRLRLYDAVVASFRAGCARGAVDNIIRDQVDFTRRALREQTEKHFAPELCNLAAPTRRARGAALDALSQFDTLDHYRLQRRFSPRETHALLVDAIGALLTPVPQPHKAQP